MEINKIKQAAEIAKARTSDKRWLAAIDKAVDALTNGKWIVTELVNCHVITSASGETYKVTEKICQCGSYFYNRPCAHRAAVRLLKLAESLEEIGIRQPPPEASAIETAEAVATKAATSRITRSIERDRTGVQYVAVYCDDWAI
jgi:hypothetical protein